MVRKRKPNWWLLYLTVPLMLGLLLIESQVPYALVVHRMAEFAIVLFGFGLMFLWVRANEGGLVDEEMEKGGWIIGPDPAKRTTNWSRPRSDECDDAADDHRQLEPSAVKGRYN